MLCISQNLPNWAAAKQLRQLSLSAGESWFGENDGIEILFYHQILQVIVLPPRWPLNTFHFRIRQIPI